MPDVKKTFLYLYQRMCLAL